MAWPAPFPGWLLEPSGDAWPRGMTVTPQGAQDPAYRPTPLFLPLFPLHDFAAFRRFVCRTALMRRLRRAGDNPPYQCPPSGIRCATPLHAGPDTRRGYSVLRASVARTVFCGSTCDKAETDQALNELSREVWRIVECALVCRVSWRVKSFGFNNLGNLADTTPELRSEIRLSH